jgi:hypothetical protein
MKEEVGDPFLLEGCVVCDPCRAGYGCGIENMITTLFEIMEYQI